MLSCRVGEWAVVAWVKVAVAAVVDMRPAKIGVTAAVLATIRRGLANATMDMSHIINILVTNIRLDYTLFTIISHDENNNSFNTNSSEVLYRKRRDI